MSLEMTTSLTELLVGQSPDAVVFSDSSGVIRYWNSAATRVFGFTVQQAVGQSLDIIIPERFREPHWKGFRQAIETGSTKYQGQALATRSLRSDGKNIYVELSFAIVLDDAGDVLGALSHARDITERFEQERANRKRVRELENQLGQKS